MPASTPRAAVDAKLPDCRGVLGSASTTTCLHENPRLRILDVRLQPGSSTSSFLGRPTVRWQVLDASATTPPPAFHPAGAEFTIANPGQQERRDLVFEILHEPERNDEEVQQLMAATSWPTAPGQVMMLENRYVRMWDFRSSLGMDRQDFHQHVLDNAWVVLGDGSALNVFSPDGQGGARFEKTVAFHDGFVSWSSVDNGGFAEDGAPLAPKCLHSVDNAAHAEFREYLIELK